MTERISVSDIAQSLAGRDKEQYYYVVKTEDKYVYVVNGKQKKVAQPKRKKRKHIMRAVLQSESPVAVKLQRGDIVLDSEIRRALAEYATLRRKLTEEGIALGKR